MGKKRNAGALMTLRSASTRRSEEPAQSNRHNNGNLKKKPKVVAASVDDEDDVSGSCDFALFTEQLKAVADPKRGASTARFFKVGEGTYTGPNDIFIGITTPDLRAFTLERLVQFPNERVVAQLFESNVHEHRAAAMMCLVALYEHPRKFHARRLLASEEDDAHDDDAQRRRVLKFYLSKTKYINNWDLTDYCHKIVGDALVRFHHQQLDATQQAISKADDLSLLFRQQLPSWYTQLLFSREFWELRIAIVALLALKKSHTELVYALIECTLDELQQGRQLLIRDQVFEDLDLIHKAIGWIVRECGKQNQTKLIAFLKEHHSKMARITISYATEKLARKPAFLKPTKRSN